MKDTKNLNKKQTADTNWVEMINRASKEEDRRAEERRLEEIEKRKLHDVKTANGIRCYCSDCVEY